MRKLVNLVFSYHAGSVLSLNTQVHLHSRKKSSGSRITGIQVFLSKLLTYACTLLLVVFLTQGYFLQFFKNDSRRVMITSEDSKIHILDGVEIVHKYKGIGLFLLINPSERPVNDHTYHIRLSLTPNACLLLSWM